MVVIRHGADPAINKILHIESGQWDAIARLDITRDQLWPDGYFDLVSFDNKGIGPDEAERIVDKLKIKLSWKIIDDALYTTLPEYYRHTLRNQPLQLPVRAIKDPQYNSVLDELNEEFDEESLRLRRAHWLDFKSDNFLPVVKQYIQHNLEYQAHKGTPLEEQCKIGFSGYDGESEGGEVDLPPIFIRPLNHLVTSQFNLELAEARLKNEKKNRYAENIWRQCLEFLSEGKGKTFRLPFPSQLFLELAIMTTDGYIPISHKNVTTSVYAKRAGGKVKTCGPERGSPWSAIVKENEKGHHYLDLSEFIADSLLKEYKIILPSTSSEKLKTNDLEKVLRLKKDPVVDIHSFAIQCFHLNSALLGVCILPISRSVLFDHLKKIETTGQGGMHFGSNPEFVEITEVDSLVTNESDTKLWHGTALARLKRLSDQRDELEKIAKSLI